jgi:heme peroxidase
MSSTTFTPPQTTQSCVIAPHLKEAVTTGSGKYGRMFAGLPVNDCAQEALLALGRSGALLDAQRDAQDDVSAQATPTAAGWPIFGQFIAHNITADRSMLQAHASLGELRNFRTPSLNLESLYGAGPSGSPYMYDRADADKLILGMTDAGEERDLPRNSQGTAIIGDPRDDVHLPISQLHVAFIALHNAIVDWLRAQDGSPAPVFAEAQRLARWHYQWITVHEYLPLLVGADRVEDILSTGRRFYQFAEQPYIPIEFSDGAYRFGHSQIRAEYQLNDSASGRIFPDLMCGCQTTQAHVMDWRYFFDLDPARPPQPSRRIDARLVHPLIQLPAHIVGATEFPEEASLAYRDLQRGRALDMPSGEEVARAMGVTPLTVEEIGLGAHGWRGETPLWYYVMRESAAREDGVRLGAVGGRIVAEVLIGLLQADSTAYLAADPTWRPTLPAVTPGDYTIADLLRFAGVA